MLRTTSLAPASDVLCSAMVNVVVWRTSVMGLY